MEQGIHARFQTPMAYYYNTDLIDDLKSYIYSLEGKGVESNVAVHVKHNLVESKFDLFSHKSDIIQHTERLFIRLFEHELNHVLVWYLIT